MIIVLRYAFLLALGMASIFAFISATAVTGQMLIAGSGHTVQNPEDMGVWVLAGMAVLTALSLFRFVFSGLPAMAKTWYQNNKDKLFTLIIAGVVCAVFLVV